MTKSLFDYLEQRNRVKEIEERQIKFERLESEAPMQTWQEPAHSVPEGTSFDDEIVENAIVEAICGAAQSGNVHELTCLLSTEEGLSYVNTHDWSGYAPIHRAANDDQLESLRVLVELGHADLECVKEGQGTGLTLAAKWGYSKISEYLLSKGASKEKAIEEAADYDKELIEGFFEDLERVSRLRIELEAKHEELQAAMRTSEEPEMLPTTCKGVTIGGLRKIKSRMLAECESGRFKEDRSFSDGTHCKGTVDYEDLTTTDIVYRYVKDVNAGVDLCLADHPGLLDSTDKAVPSLFVSHAWKGRFSKLLEMIIGYAEDRGLPDNYAVWLDLLAVNQPSEGLPTSLPTDFLTTTFQEVLKTCLDGTLVICDFEKCITPSRAWCLFEWDWTMFYHGREKLQVVGLSVEEAEEGMNTLDVDQAQCFKVEDREMILNAIVDKHGSTDQFNEKLRKKWGDMAYEAQSRLPKYEGEG